MATKKQIAEVKAECDKLFAELTQYVGPKKADHFLSMAERCIECNFGYKRDGFAWFKMLRGDLEDHLTSPQYKTLYQISPETEQWGGFLSHDVSHVPGPSLRDDPDWGRR